MQMDGTWTIRFGKQASAWATVSECAPLQTRVIFYVIFNSKESLTRRIETDSLLPIASQLKGRR